MKNKYPHHIKIALTDDMVQTMKTDINMQQRMECLHMDESTVLAIHILMAIEKGEDGPIFLMSNKEARAKKAEGSS